MKRKLTCSSRARSVTLCERSYHRETLTSRLAKTRLCLRRCVKAKRASCAAQIECAHLPGRLIRRRRCLMRNNSRKQ